MNSWWQIMITFYLVVFFKLQVNLKVKEERMGLYSVHWFSPMLEIVSWLFLGSVQIIFSVLKSETIKKYSETSRIFNIKNYTTKVLTKLHIFWHLEISENKWSGKILIKLYCAECYQCGNVILNLSLLTNQRGLMCSVYDLSLLKYFSKFLFSFMSITFYSTFKKCYMIAVIKDVDISLSEYCLIKE